MAAATVIEVAGKAAVLVAVVAAGVASGVVRVTVVQGTRVEVIVET